MVKADTFDKLKKLQDILVQKYELDEKIKEEPKQLDVQEELLARLKKEFIEKNTTYESIKDNVLKIKFDLEEAIKSRESGEKGMDNITTHREYEALEKQILEATDRENELRKDLQKQEKSQEELKETLNGLEDMIKTQEDDLSASKEALNKKLAEFNTQKEKLDKEEKKISPDLDQETVFKFQRIIQRNSEGIVAVKNGVCTGCHMILPAQFANTVHVGDEIQFCPYCSRILFYEEADEDAQENYYNFNEAGSLVDMDDFDDDEDYDSEEEKEIEEEEMNYEDEEDSDSDSISDDDEEEISDEEMESEDEE
jgi:predicted  nucleic acid-binding Zn-ribbon protein